MLSTATKVISHREGLVPFANSLNSNHSILEVKEILPNKIKCSCIKNATEFTLFHDGQLDLKEVLGTYILVQNKMGELIRIKSTNEMKTVWHDGQPYDAFVPGIDLSFKPMVTC